MRDLVLVVDDNEDIRAFVRLSLESQDFRVIEAVNALDAMVKLVNEKPNLIILDIGIGQPDGLEVCREVRKHSEVPIIMLTVRDDEIDEAMCLAAGANDYLTKPVSKTILGLRVANQLRTKKDVNSQAPTVLKAAELSLDLLTRELRVGETLVPITRTEFDFIHLLMEESILFLLLFCNGLCNVLHWRDIGNYITFRLSFMRTISQNTSNNTTPVN